MSTVQLGDIELSDYLQLPGLKNMAKRAGSVRQLAGGGMVDQSHPISADTITVEAVRSGGGVYGFFTGAQLDGIQALEASGETVLFTHHQGSWYVVVKKTDLYPVWQYKSAPTATDKYVGTVTLQIKGA